MAISGINNQKNTNPIDQYREELKVLKNRLKGIRPSLYEMDYTQKQGEIQAIKKEISLTEHKIKQSEKGQAGLQEIFAMMARR
jgi:hypothetical protein